MGHTPIQRFRFFSICWNIIYMCYAIVHIPIIALLLHLSPSVRLNTQLLTKNPIFIAFPLTNVVIILGLCAFGIIGLLLSTKIKCGRYRVASMIILGLHATFNLLLMLIRGVIVAFCIRTLFLISKNFQTEPITTTPIQTTTSEPNPTTFPDSHYCALVSIIIVLFLMILSAITELIQVIFSSLVLHQVRLEDKKEVELASGGQYLKMDSTVL